MTNEQKFKPGDKVQIRMTDMEESWSQRDGHVGVVKEHDGSGYLPYAVHFPDDSCYEAAYGYFDEKTLTLWVEPANLPAPVPEQHPYPNTPTAEHERQFGPFDWTFVQRGLAVLDGIPLGEADGWVRDFGESVRAAMNHYGIPHLAPNVGPAVGDYVRISIEEEEHGGRIARIVEDDGTDLPYRVSFTPEGLEEQETAWMYHVDVEVIDAATVEPIAEYRLI